MSGTERGEASEHERDENGNRLYRHTGACLSIKCPCYVAGTAAALAEHEGLQAEVEGWREACRSQGLPESCTPAAFVRHHRNNAALAATANARAAEAEVAALRTEREALREALTLAERALRDQPMLAFQAESARHRRAQAIDIARRALARTDTGGQE